jgi:hypothetical protein
MNRRRSGHCLRAPSGRVQLLVFTAVCSGANPAHRGRRYPARAHGGTVYASLRLRCGARPGVAPHNSLRSDSCGELVYEARFARRPQACAPRRPTNRPCRALPAAKATGTGLCHANHRCTGKGAPGQVVARLRGVDEHRPCGRARSAPRELTCRPLSERSERSERSELCDGPQGRASQGSRCAAPTAPPKRCRLPGCDFAAPVSARLAHATRQRSN